MGVNQMTGTPWHVETLRMDEDDTRRHKSRCVHYQKTNKYCTKQKRTCPASAHCDYYKEDPTRIKAEPQPLTSRYHSSAADPSITRTRETAERTTVYDGSILFPVGSHVIHKSFGSGTVIESDQDQVTVMFANNTSKELSVDYCGKKSLLQRVITEEEKRIAKVKAEKERQVKESNIEYALKTSTETKNTIAEPIKNKEVASISKVCLKESLPEIEITNKEKQIAKAKENTNKRTIISSIKNEQATTSCSKPNVSNAEKPVSDDSKSKAIHIAKLALIVVIGTALLVFLCLLRAQA